MKENIEQFKRLREEGMTYKDIGFNYGITKQRVEQIVHSTPNYSSKKTITYNFDNYTFSPDIDHLKINKLPTFKRIVTIELEFIDYSKSKIPTKMEGIDRVREEVRLRDNHTCQKCFSQWKIGERRYDVHHLDEQMESVKDYTYDKENQDKMITYCHKCHLNLHTVKEKMIASNRIPKSSLLTLNRLLETKWFLKMGFNQREIADIIGIKYQNINRYVKILSLNQAK